MANTLKDIANSLATTQVEVVNDLLEDSPILATLPFKASSHPMWNAYLERKEVIGGQMVDLNGILPNVSQSSDLKQTFLSVIGGISEVDEDTALMLGGARKYFADQEPDIMKETGMTTEKKIYDNFVDFSIANGTSIKTLATTAVGEIFHTMVAVRFAPGEVYGYHSPVGLNTDGMLMDVKPIGSSIDDVYKNSEGKLVHGVRYKGYFGVQMASTKAISAIVNIKSDKLPTEKDMNEMIRNVRGRAGNTFIFTSQEVLDMLQSFKTAGLMTVMSDVNMGVPFTMWNGIKFITSYNVQPRTFVA